MERTLQALNAAFPALLARPSLQITLRQRAKFEGWLKVELGAALADAGATVALEHTIAGARHRADIAFQLPPERQALVMLKTVNTNFRFTGVEPRTRPITQNIAGVIEDVQKLRVGTGPELRLLVFPVFPVDAESAARSAQLSPHLSRIEAAGAWLLREGSAVPPSSDGRWAVAWYIFQA